MPHFRLPNGKLSDDVPLPPSKFTYDVTVSIDDEPMEVMHAITYLALQREFYRTQVADLKQQLDEIKRSTGE